MDDHLIDLDDIDDIEDIPDIQKVEDIQRKRYSRDFVNPFEFFNEKEFKRRFRFSKNIVRNLKNGSKNYHKRVPGEFNS